MANQTRLTFALSDDKDELEIQMNRAGMEDLIYYLRRLLNTSGPLPSHDHLMTASWAGTELTEVNEGGNGSVLHKVTLRYFD